MSTDDMIKNISGALSLFADSLASVRQSSQGNNIGAEPPDFIDQLMNFFPMDKVDWEAGTYDPYLFDLRKTVLDNYDKGNYQVAYFYAHLIFMSYIYYSIGAAYEIWPDKVSDLYTLINAYAGKKKPKLDDYDSIYSFSKIPEREIIKIFYAIGMDVQYIQQLSSYISGRDNYAHASGKGNIDATSLESNIKSITRNMGTVHELFIPSLKGKYIQFLFDSYTLPYAETQERISDFISDNNYSAKDISFFTNLGISNIRNENEEFRNNYRFIQKIHCAFIEYCIDNMEIDQPDGYASLRDKSYLHYKYHEDAEGYVENELGISAYRCVKEGGEFPVYECPECGEDQLVYDSESEEFHCFSCDEHFEKGELSFCSDCGGIMRSNEMCICSNRIDRRMEE